jgi:hypothetical protein
MTNKKNMPISCVYFKAKRLPDAHAHQIKTCELHCDGELLTAFLRQIWMFETSCLLLSLFLLFFSSDSFFVL